MNARLVVVSITIGRISQRMSRPRLNIIACVGLLCAIVPFAHAAAPTVTAVLSNSDANVGEMVQLQIRINGDRKAEAPEDIAVDGLEIHRTGTEQHFEMNNLSVTSSIVYTYTVLSERAGTFKIPAQTIQIGGSPQKTPELTLHVTDGGGSARSNRGATRGTTSDDTVSTKNAAFLEIVVPKRAGYVGEVLPVEVRLGFNTRVRLQRYEPPEITAQGLTLRKAQQPQESTQSVNGVTYNVLTWKGAVAATTSGKIELPPLESKAVLLLPRRRGSAPRSRSPFDLFGMNDPFSDPMFADPFGSMAEPRQITVKSEPVTLEIKPLPPKAPPSFSGAVGNFSIAADANPKRVQSGDPITATATVSGRGNFDRVNAPMLEDERGWHKYPPSGKYKQDDDVGISGTKTFEMVLSTTEARQALPPFLFTYFDPIKEDYVTAKTDPIAIQVQGAAAPVSAAARSQTPAIASATPAASRPPQNAIASDILQQLPERGSVVSTFSPLYARRGFLLAQLIPALALAGFMAWALRRRAMGDRNRLAAARLRRDLDVELRKLRAASASSHDYLASAARVVQLKAALKRGGNPESIDAENAGDAFAATAQQRQTLRRIFEQKDEMRYSGRTSNGDLPPEARREILELIESLPV